MVPVKIATAVLLLLLGALPTRAQTQDASDARPILQRYAAAWRGREEMPLSDSVVVAFWIRGNGGGEYHVVLRPEGPATIADGVPLAYDGGFQTDIGTLRRIDRGELSALTAMARTRASDPSPMEPRFPPGFRWTPATQALLLPLAFHFWNRDWPEVVPFAAGAIRRAHGARTSLFYYDHGLRTSYYRLDPATHMNSDARDRVNPFATLWICTRGSMRARVAGTTRLLREGEALFIPAGASHEFWTGPRERAEAIIVMFGEGA